MPPLGLPSLIRLINSASKKVPAVRYAFGLVGIAACGAVIALVLGTTKSAIVILSLTFLGSILLFVFARLSTSPNPSVFTAGLVLIWGVVGFFTLFLAMTTTAFVAAWPLPWAQFLGISLTQEASLCDARVRVMWTQFFNPDIQYSDALKTADTVARCAPFQSLSLKGAVAFYSGRYFDAVTAFEAAHKLDPHDDPIARNLADSYVEVGRLDDALALYKGLKEKDALWNYKVSRVEYYAGHYDKALALVRTIPTDLSEDGDLLGRPRILEAAILSELAKTSDASVRHDLLDKAKAQFDSGIEFDHDKWMKIFRLDPHRTKHETFKKQYDTLQPYLSKWRFDSK